MDWCNVDDLRSEYQGGCFWVFFNGYGILLEVSMVRMTLRSSLEDYDSNYELMWSWCKWSSGGGGLVPGYLWSFMVQSKFLEVGV